MALCLTSPGSSLFTGRDPFHPRRHPRRKAAPQFFVCSCSSEPNNGASSKNRLCGEAYSAFSMGSSPSPSAVSSSAPISSFGGLVQMLENANKHLAKLALATAVAGLVAFSPTGDALAAKSGGRIGGQAFRSAPPPSAAPRANSSRTNVYINPPSYGAPPLFGGYGSPYYGGWGWSPFSFFVPGPSIAVGVGGGFNLFGFFLLMSVFLGVVNFFRRGNDDDDYD